VKEHPLLALRASKNPGGSTMGLWDKLKGELIDIIEWTEPSGSELLAYRFPRYNNEIKYGAKLTVREGQAAAFVNEGTLADVYMPGMYTLETNNMPILATLKGWKYGFNSPFKAEVYFISTKQWTDLKWGTQNPIMLRDPEFGPMRVRAFGTYAMRVSDPGKFLKELVATDPSFETFDITNQLRNMIVSRFVDVIAQAKLPVLDLAGNYEKIGKIAHDKVGGEMAGMGLALTQFYVENISLPEEVEQALDTRAKIGVLGNLDQYTRLQTADAIRDAAKNPGGVAGLGAGIGAGAAIGSQMGAAMGGMQSAGNVPPPMPTVVGYFLGVNGQQQGPFDLAALASKLKDGILTPTTLVWKPGMKVWTAASSVDDLQGLFASAPPPLPK
jgi:membrane protease subunit (stomatin/prohibitin family)